MSVTQGEALRFFRGDPAELREVVDGGDAVGQLPAVVVPLLARDLRPGKADRRRSPPSAPRAVRRRHQGWVSMILLEYPVSGVDGRGGSPSIISRSCAPRGMDRASSPCSKTRTPLLPREVEALPLAGHVRRSARAEGPAARPATARMQLPPPCGGSGGVPFPGGAIVAR